MSAVPFSYSAAAAVQYRRHSSYTVWLVSPDGQREYIGRTANRTGRGLMAVLSGENAQAVVKRLPNADRIQFRKTAAALILDNGYRIEFGGTIRQESAA